MTSGKVIVLSTVATTLLLAACTDHGQGITPGYEALPACNVQDEVPVDELDQDRLHDCNPEGLNIRMPDGRVLQVAAVGVTHAITSSAPDQPGEITVINWGIEGVGVAYRNGDERMVWGSTEKAAGKQTGIWVPR